MNKGMKEEEKNALQSSPNFIFLSYPTRGTDVNQVSFPRYSLSCLPPYLCSSYALLILYIWFYLTYTVSQNKIKISKFKVFCINACKWKKLKVLVAQSCLTFCDPMDYSQSVSVHGIFQARIPEWVAISFSRGPSQSRDQTWVSWTTSRFFTDWANREAHMHVSWLQIQGRPPF